jgi:hypothetical protein
MNPLATWPVTSIRCPQTPRNLWHGGSLQRAAAYIDGELTQAGYAISASTCTQATAC